MLPPEVLADIHPLTACEAAEIPTVPADNASVVSRSASDFVDVRRWLRSVQPDSQVRVYVSWSRDLAVETAWHIFTEYWDDFCYPSSDDVMVVPAGGTWQLIYHHYEQFDFVRGS
ncbi:MAG TPA: hypothetical protein VMU04_10135 [Candidatus Acidoferrum sp.]|nr:hypothetical protein [Candidatus Acidoferrum sp.]